jgi:hypothetical protein
MITARVLYKSRLLVTGITFLCLGIGNWIVGNHKVADYQSIMTQASPAVVPKSSLLAKGTWKLPTEEVERANIARAKVDFYHVVVSGGRLLASIGALCTIAALIRLRARW